MAPVATIIVRVVATLLVGMGHFVVDSPKQYAHTNTLTRTLPPTHKEHKFCARPDDTNTNESQEGSSSSQQEKGLASSELSGNLHGPKVGGPISPPNAPAPRSHCTATASDRFRPPVGTTSGQFFTNFHALFRDRSAHGREFACWGLFPSDTSAEQQQRRVSHQTRRRNLSLFFNVVVVW